MAIWGVLSAVALLGGLTEAIPTVTFPLNSQVPPVARVSEPFSYTLSPSTFFSTLPLTYALTSGPSWLSLDSSTLTLSGTPSAKDAGAGTVTGIPIGITASDSTGSTNLNSTLVISKNDPPAISIPSSKQLPTFGQFSAPSTLLYHPSSPFDFSFDKQTFSGSGLSYYAVTSDNTPLPSWVLFDAEKLEFSGQTPDVASLIQPPQVFGIRLVASDVEGFAGSSILFDIKVGVHLLAISSDDLVMEATPGEDIKYNDLAGAVQLDGQQIESSEIASATANTPSWLKFDSKTLQFSGTVPQNASPSNVTARITDIYENVATANIQILVSTDIFSRQIGELNATIGSSFRYNMSSYLFNPSDIEMEADLPGGISWISFDSRTFVLSGNVPDDTSVSDLEVSLKATSKSTQATNSQSFKFVVTESATKTSSTSSSPSPSATSSHTGAVSSPSSTGDAVSTAGSRSGLSTSAIVAITVPLALLLLTLMVAFACCVRRRNISRSRPSSPSKSDISGRDGPLSSVIEIISYDRPVIPPPEPLELDTSDFGRPTSSVLLSNDKPIDTSATAPAPIAMHAITTDTATAAPNRKSQQQLLRRSQTTSAISDQRLSRVLRESASSGNRRSHSDNALSKTDGSWSYTQGSTDSNFRSSRTVSSHRLTRNYSNYSRKGHARRSARVLSYNDINNLRESSESGLRLNPPNRKSSAIPPVQTEQSILGLRDSSFSYMPVDAFSALSTQTSLRHTKSNKRHSRFMPGYVPQAGIGHGARESTSTFSGKRSSIGHGAGPRALSRDSKTWLTIASAEIAAKRDSKSSNYSEYSGGRGAGAGTAVNPRMSIRLVPRSSETSFRPSKAPSYISEASYTSSRPVSRGMGSSPFFGGSSVRKSRKLSTKRIVRTSYADSPTVPEEQTMPGLEETILRGMREEARESTEQQRDSQRDSLGISYGRAREGTRQLQSFLQKKIQRDKANRSLMSIESKDSRFESAENSMMDIDRPVRRIDGDVTIGEEEGETHGDGFDEDDYSEGSWETHHTSHDSSGNIVEYAPGHSASESNTTSERDRASMEGGGLMGNPVTGHSSVRRKRKIEPEPRIVEGVVVRRPVSVDVGASRKRSSNVLFDDGSHGHGRSANNGGSIVDRGRKDYTAFM